MPRSPRLGTMLPSIPTVWTPSRNGRAASRFPRGPASLRLDAVKEEVEWLTWYRNPAFSSEFSADTNNNQDDDHA